jgi:hypothetical protein
MLHSRSRDPNAKDALSTGSKDTVASMIRSSMGNMNGMLPSSVSPKNSANPADNTRGLATVGSGGVGSTGPLPPSAVVGKDAIPSGGGGGGGGSLSSKSSGGTLQKILRGGSGAGGNGDGTGIKTLSTTMAELLRDLMKDKRRFDQYVEALQQSNRENLDRNDFYARPTTGGNGGGNASTSGDGVGSGHYHHHSVSYNTRESVSAAATPGAASSSSASSAAAGGAANHHASSFSVAMSDGSPNSAAAAAVASGAMGHAPVGGSKGIRAMRAAVGASIASSSSSGGPPDAHHPHGHFPVRKLNRAEVELLHRTAPHTRLYINFKPHEVYLHSQEQETLKSQFEEYMYRTAVGQKTDAEGNLVNVSGYKTEQGGLSRPLTVEVKLPGLPPDRDLDKENRHKDLIGIPLNKDPLPKDFRPPEQGELARVSTSDKRNTIRLSESSGGLNGLDTVEEESFQSSGNTHHTNPLSPFSSGSLGKGKAAKFVRAPSLSSIGKHASLGDMSRGKAAPLDPRSPLVKTGSQIFNTNK